MTVSTDNDFVQDVTLAELAEIFSTAETWQDVRPEWPPEPILRYSPGTDSGTFDYFVEQLFVEDPGPLLNASNLQLSENNNVLRQGVEASPFSVGVFDYAYADQQRDRLSLLALDGTAPTSQTVEAGSYPLARPLYMYSDAGIMQRKTQVAAFLNYALTNVNDLIGDVDYTQATTATLNQAKQTWLDAMAQDVFNERVYLPLVRRGGGAASTTIKIAVQSPLSGPQATLGTGIRNAAELAIQQQAAQLTNLGFTVELVPYDNEARPERGVANANIITADPDIRCVVGHLNSGVALGALPFYQNANLLMVSPATTNPRITDDFTNTLRLVGRDDVQGAAAARFTHEHLDVQSVYIIHDQTSYGQEIAQAFWQRSETYDLDVLAFEGTQEQSVFDSVITPIQATRPDLVYFSGIYDQAGRFFAQARDRGIEAVFMGPEGLNNSTLLDAGGSAVDGLYYTTTTAPAAFYPQAVAFAQDYQRIYETSPPIYAAQSYDATGICIQTIAQAAQDVNGAPTRAQVLAAVRDLDTYQGITGSYTFTAQGDPTTTTYYVWQVDATNWADNTLVAEIPVPFPLSTEHVPPTPDPTPTPTATPPPSPTPTATRPTDAFLRDAAFIDEQCGWLVHGVGNDAGERIGTELLATCDSGQTWTTRYTTTASLGEIDFISQQQGWMVISGTLHTTTDSGYTWQPFATHVLTRVARVDFVDAQHGWVRSATRYPNHGLLRTTDGGQTWQELDEPCSSFWRPGMASFVSPTDGWLMCGSTPGAGHQGKTLYRTTDGGQSWHKVTTAPYPPDAKPGDLPSSGYLNGFFFLDDEHGWMSSGRFPIGIAYTTSDGGQTWDGIGYDIGSDGTKGRLHFTSPTHGTMLMRVDNDYDAPQGMRMRYVLVRTTDGGQTWEQIYP